MQLHFVVVLAILGISGIVSTYEIPTVDMELIGNGSDGFNVSIPYTKGIKNVFYVIEINGASPVLADYVTKPQNNCWSMKNKSILRNNDRIAISILVQYNEKVYKNAQQFLIRKHKPVFEKKFQNVDIDDTCPQISAHILKHADTDKPAQTIVRTNMGEPKTIDFTNKLIFEENFDANNLDTTKWCHEIGMLLTVDGHLSEEFVLFNDSKANIQQVNGYLKIVPTLYHKVINEGKIDLGERCTSSAHPKLECVIDTDEDSTTLFLPPVHSAQITTKKNFGFKYGRIEVRAKLSKGDWLLPYIMLQPVRDEDPDFRKQIHIAFIRGNDKFYNADKEDVGGSLLHGGLKLIQKSCDQVEFCSPITQMPTIKKDKHFGTAFHNYTLTWTEKGISLAVDGDIYGNISDEIKMFNDEFYYISLAVSAGGHMIFMDTTYNDKPWQNTNQEAPYKFFEPLAKVKNLWKNGGEMKIDYIRVYSV